MSMALKACSSSSSLISVALTIKWTNSSKSISPDPSVLGWLWGLGQAVLIHWWISDPENGWLQIRTDKRQVRASRQTETTHKHREIHQTRKLRLPCLGTQQAQLLYCCSATRLHSFRPYHRLQSQPSWRLRPPVKRCLPSSARNGQH